MSDFFDMLEYSDNHYEPGDIDEYPPGIIAKLNAVKIYQDIYNKYNIEPSYAGYNREQGVYIRYNYMKFNKYSFSLIIETYDDGESAVMINDNISNEDLLLKDVYDLNFDEAVKYFMELRNKE